ncbi:MotA/TolQ/ExbB proton channel family protein [Marinobacterium jannaschii]|uniref:MotA/TolQ/ExbB proton channel family protein n=1 Tax=Marinobacterium jannaschii TaxID=64970 RepID=UPI0004835676|nr:MotA/TolQ/ExbB proton channel family protein [Marinobacterium jannaschii]
MQLDRELAEGVLLQFLHAGGPVLLLLAGLALILWSLLLERIWFKYFDYPRMRKRCYASSGLAQMIHQRCDALIALQNNLPLIKTLIALCPLVGLLGTVTGMIQVFDQLALNGTGNARLMAAGVARATLPTMAGMVVAVTGLLLYSRLQRWSQLQQNSLRAMGEPG